MFHFNRRDWEIAGIARDRASSPSSGLGMMRLTSANVPAGAFKLRGFWGCFRSRGSRAIAAIFPISLTVLPASVYSPSSLHAKKDVRFHGHSSCRNLELSLLVGVGAHTRVGPNPRPQAGGAFSQD